MKIAAILLCCAFSVNAWEVLPGYPETVYATQGSKIESNGPFKNNIEIALVESSGKLLMSFYNYNDKDDQVIVPYVEYIARGCEIQGGGKTVYGVMLPDDKTMSKQMIDCDSAIFVRVYNNLNEYATYKIPEVNT